MTQIPENTMSLTAAAVREFSADILDQEICRGWVLHKIHVDGAKCPRCGSPLATERQIASFWSGGRVACKPCGRFFDAHTGTILCGTALNYRQIYFIGVLLGLGMTVRQVSDRAGLNESTVRDWRERLTLVSVS